MTTKMTKRDYFNELKDMAIDAERIDLANFCDHQIELLDAKAAKAKAVAATKKAAGDELTDMVLAALTSEFESIADIAARIEGEDVTVSKVSYRLNALAKAGKAVKGELAIAGAEGGKTRKVVAYAVAE